VWQREGEDFTRAVSASTRWIGGRGSTGWVTPHTALAEPLSPRGPQPAQQRCGISATAPIPDSVYVCARLWTVWTALVVPGPDRHVV
jgi:hypothetical protein